MYNYTDDNFLDSKNLSSFSFATKNFNPFIRGRFDINNFSQLPAIKEEEGSISDEDSEIITTNLKHIKSFTKFPHLNINCLMNIDVKQSHSIWNTNFGKRLIHDYIDCEGLSEPNVRDIKFVQKSSEKQQLSKPFSRRKIVQKNNGKNGGEVKIELKQTKSFRKKLKKISKENQNFGKRKINYEKNFLETTPKTKPIGHLPEISKEILHEETSSSSLNSKPQQFLTEHVKNIFKNYSDHSKCEYCDETFPDFEDLCNHQKQHEAEKETCLLCKKVFYNSSDFVQHLLTHEGVDRFSCKKCKKYFPNLRKYKQHDEEFHYKPPPNLSFISPPKLEFVKEWLPKFECKRCKIELDSEQTYEAHRRAHVRKDLARAYLLSFKNIAL